MTSFDVERYKKLSTTAKAEKDRAIAINSRVNADAPNDKAAEGVTWSGIGKSQSRGARIFQLDTKRPPLSVDLDLKAMNENYAVVRIGGKTRVVSFEGSETHRGSTVPVFSTIPDFRAFHDRVKKQVGTGAELKHIGLGTWWINHSERTQYDGIVYAPEADPKGKLNLWKGFVCEPKEGSCDLYLQHVRENICGGHEEYFHYLIGWMAYAVQYPGKQGEVAVVLRGREGTGKGMFAHYFGTLFGPHFVHVSHASHLTGHFNAHLQYCSVLFADEAFFAGDRSHESVLKALITEPRIVIEPKGLDAFQAKNCISLIMASNSEWVVPAGADARRYFVLDVSDAQIQNEEYFAAIQKEADNGGREALLYYLQDVDLSQFKLRSVPETAALADQKMRSRRGVDSLIEYIAHEGNLLCPHLAHADVALTTGEQKGQGFYVEARKLVPDLKHTTSIVLANALKDWGCTRWKSNGQTGIKFPPLSELRARFDSKHGPQEWDDMQAWSHLGSSL